MSSSSILRSYNRSAFEMRPISIEIGVSEHAEGSAMVSFGKTRVFCTASIDDDVPYFLRDGSQGWITAEYNMLPRATNTRNRRVSTASSGRTLEIQRLIGRSMRSITNLKALGKRQIFLDCDVLDADGGTRQASIVGAFVALQQAMKLLVTSGLIKHNPLMYQVAAVSVGIVGKNILVDLDYDEDSNADTDATIVLTKDGKIIEFQLSAENTPLAYDQFTEFYSRAREASKQIFQTQERALAGKI